MQSCYLGSAKPIAMIHSTAACCIYCFIVSHSRGLVIGLTVVLSGHRNGIQTEQLHANNV
jgi:hypothetical protein